MSAIDGGPSRTTISADELSVLCAVDTNLSVSGRGGTLFGLIALGLVTEQRCYVLTDEGREIIDRYFPEGWMREVG